MVRRISNQSLRVRAVALGLLTALITSSSCGKPVFLGVGDDEAEELAYAHKLVPILLGREVRSHDEAEVLRGLIEATDRATAVRALMEEDEFSAHWGRIVAAHLRTHAARGRTFIGCDGPGAPAFVHMRAAVHAALTEDNLYPLYQAYLSSGGNEALLSVVGAGLEEEIWSTVIGQPRAIATGSSRRAGEDETLGRVPRQHFTSSHWPLKELLVQILTSDHFTHRAAGMPTPGLPIG